MPKTAVGSFTNPTTVWGAAYLLNPDGPTALTASLGHSAFAASLVGDANAAARLTALGFSPLSASLPALLTALTYKAALNLDHVFDARDYGAVGDGVTDDQPALAAAIAAANAVDGTVFLPPGTYFIAATVAVSAGVTLAGSGSSSIITATMDDALVRLNSGSTIRDMAVIGDNNPLKTAQFGVIAAASAMRPRVLNCEIAYVGRDGWYDRSGSVNGSLVQGCYIHHCGDDGINPGSGTAGSPYADQILGNYITNCRNSGIHCSTNSRHLIVADNVIRDCGGGIDMYDTSDLTIVNNLIMDPDGVGPDTDGDGIAIVSGTPAPGRLLIQGNRVVNAFRHGITIRMAATEVLILGNIIDLPTNRGIWMGSTPAYDCYGIIEGNIIRSTAAGASDHGIYIERASRLLIIGNQVKIPSATADQRAVSVDGVSGLTIANNILSGGGRTVELLNFNAGSLLVANNQLLDGATFSLSLTGPTTGTYDCNGEIVGNYCSNDITLRGVAGATVANNVATDITEYNDSDTNRYEANRLSGAYTLTGTRSSIDNGMRGTATPVGAITPTRVGVEFFDATAKVWYKATGLTNADWVALN